MSNQWEKITENNHEMRKCSHLKCTGVRKKENDFIFKATEFGEKCWKINLFSKEWARLIMHLLVPSVGFGYNIDVLIFMHMWYVFSLHRRYGVHKKMRFLIDKIINSTFVFIFLSYFPLSLINYLWQKNCFPEWENSLPKKINFSRGANLKPLILQLHL